MNVTVIPAIHYAGTGTQTQFAIPFDYLRKAFIHATVNDEVVTDYEILGSQIIFKEAPAVGADVYIYRDTSTTRLVSWKDASILHAKDMTIQQVQELHILEEEDYKFNGVLDGSKAASDAAIEAKEQAEVANATAQNAMNEAKKWAKAAEGYVLPDGSVTNAKLGEDVNKRLSAAEGDAIIFMSDSYGESPSVGEDWISFIRARIPNVSYRAHRSGGGFGSPIKFLDALREIENTVVEKEKVKQIIVGCGYNDWGYQSEIAAGVASFSEYVRVTYPNAMIKVFLIGFTNNGDNEHKIINEVKAQYRQQAVTFNNFVYVEGSEYIHRNYRHIGFDGIHPNADGATIIGTGILGYVKDGIINLPVISGVTNYATPSGFNTATSPMTLMEDFLGDKIQLSLFAHFVVANGATSFFDYKEIATITNPTYIRGLTGTFLKYATPCMVLNQGSARWEAAGAVVLIKDGKIYLQLTSFDTPAQIWLPENTVLLATKYC